MGNEKVGHAQTLLQVLKQIDDLGLDGHIQRRHRLVADDERWLDGERARRGYSLALPARKLVRIPRSLRTAKSDELQDFLNAIAPVLTALVELVDHHRLFDDLAYRHPRIQRAIRILEDHLHPPSRAPLLVSFEAGDRLAFKYHLTRRRCL